MILYNNYVARNILVFDGGRTVKLCDFDSAVVASEARGHHGGFTPYFAAPEVVKGEVPRFSADIWSTLCILVEMLTARMPFCYQVPVRSMGAMFFVVSIWYVIIIYYRPIMLLLIIFMVISLLFVVSKFVVIQIKIAK